MVLTCRTRLATLVLAVGVLMPSVTRADEVTDWNQILVSALTATSTSPQNAGRIAAITHAAVFDAVNGIDPRYTPYFVTDEAPGGASRRAAAVQAAYTVLRALLPAQAAGLERQRDSSIAAIRSDQHGQSVDRGIEWGQFVASALLTERSTDGFPAGGVADPGDLTIGKWRPEAGLPPAGLPAVTPWLAVLRPFVMPTPDHFRPAGPPALDERGPCQRLRGSEARGTRDQVVTHTGADRHRFLLDGQHHLALESNRRFGRSTAPHDIGGECRLFALLNLAMADAGIAVWDAKFLYRFWRPFSAIPLAELDGNPSTEADPSWTSLVLTPNHQEFPSGHGGLSGAAARVLSRASSAIGPRSRTGPTPRRSPRVLIGASRAPPTRRTTRGSTAAYISGPQSGMDASSATTSAGLPWRHCCGRYAMTITMMVVTDVIGLSSRRCGSPDGRFHHPNRSALPA